MNESTIPVLTELQNGSDVRGVALETPNQVVTLTNDRIERIAYGFAFWLKEVKKLAVDDPHYPLRIAVGHDSRLSSERIKSALIEGLVNANFEVIDVGLATTPAMFMATQYIEYDCDAAIMITASHLPFQYNGLKFFTKDGGAEHEDIQFMLEHADWSYVYWGNMSGSVVPRYLLKDYAADLVDKIRQGINDPEHYNEPLKGRHIVVDAGNGAGGFFATAILEPLGATTSGSQFLEPDGHFPNHVPNPDNKEAMKSIQTAVLMNRADLGIIFDTDVDRSAIVSSDGDPINRNNLIGLISAILIEENPGTTIVTNSATSEHLKTFIEALGGRQNRYITGYRNVINKGIALNKEGIPTSLAIETSGHAALKENYFLDDGAFLIAKLLIADAKLKKVGKTLSDLISNLKQPVETEEVRFKIEGEDVALIGANVLEDFRDFIRETPDLTIEPQNFEGVRVNTTGVFGKGWFILRLSLHEPLLVLTMENDELGAIARLREVLKTFFNGQSDLDASFL
ncbi:phosphomannomutase/phosphoglucomutase [Carnobacterium divergens]|uniref:phosphomannomutase/phosphoglucomutase n=1 Tax=Carnobacterium divergens TaxID=2748 RepID=UPI0010715D36|nr:phosphomannomutase/phosphoglucomutase [Carnobacterium divergens]TFJ44193.1 phosphomannomutase/phosphoglucomutase [Carnobacterium divergens]TFJ50910.1 phosphomannomutase/phosphoglucomutase [Carnobacterium divergens]